MVRKLKIQLIITTIIPFLVFGCSRQVPEVETKAQTKINYKYDSGRSIFGGVDKRSLFDEVGDMFSDRTCYIIGRQTVALGESRTGFTVIGSQFIPLYSSTPDRYAESGIWILLIDDFASEIMDTITKSYKDYEKISAKIVEISAKKRQNEEHDIIFSLRFKGAGISTDEIKSELKKNTYLEDSSGKRYEIENFEIAPDGLRIFFPYQINYDKDAYVQLVSFIFGNSYSFAYYF